MSKKAIAIARQAENDNRFVLAAMLPLMGAAVMAIVMYLWA